MGEPNETARLRRQLPLLGLFLGATIGLGCLAPAAPVRAADRFGESVSVDVVNVDVYVTDRDGNPVTGLSDEDFELRENGKKVKVQYFYAGQHRQGPQPPAVAQRVAPAPGPAGQLAPIGQAEGPLSLVVLVDNVSMLPANRNRVLMRLREFLDPQLQAAQDGEVVRVLFATFDGSITIRQPFSTDPRQIAATVEQLAGLTAQGFRRAAERQAYLGTIERTLNAVSEGGRSNEKLALSEISGLIQQVPLYAESAYRDVVEMTQALGAFVGLLSGLPGRKAVVFVTDGVPMRPGQDLVFALQDAFREGSSLPGGNRGANTGEDPTAAPPPGPNASARNSAADDFAGAVEQLRRLQSELLPFDASRHFQQVSALANASRVTFYTINGAASDSTVIGPESTGGAGQYLRSSVGLASTDQANMRETLRYVAETTGGIALTSGSDVGGLLRKATTDFETYYSLGFTPKPPESGLPEYRTLEVKLKSRGRGLTVRHREGYVAGQGHSNQGDRTLAALLLGFEDNPLGLELVKTDQQLQSGDEYLVNLLLRIPVDALDLYPREGFREANLTLYVGLQDAGGAVRLLPRIAHTVKLTEDQLASAQGRIYGAQLPLRLHSGAQKVVVGLWQPGSSAGSFVSSVVTVSPEQSAGAGR